MRINNRTLSEITRHNRRLGVRRVVKGIGYERSAELPYVVDLLKSRFGEELDYLDIGTGDSVLPTFLFERTRWRVTCLDKCDWVFLQDKYRRRCSDASDDGRFSIVNTDLLSYAPSRRFDIITSISVIEHFAENLDSRAMEHTGALLKEGGLCILTTLVNDGYPAEFFVEGEVYGERSSSGTFYQRHYDVKSLEERVIKPSGLCEISRTYFGEYGFPFGERFIFPTIRRNPLKVVYTWAAPSFSRRFVRYSDKPVSRPGMPVNTASGVIVVLQRASMKDTKCAE